MLRNSVVLWALLGAVGCAAPRVNLRAPDPRASLQERLDAYDQLQPMSYEQRTLIFQSGHTQDLGPGAMLLANGEQVMDTRDLLTVVDPNSPTANAAERAEQIFDRGVKVALVGVGFIAASLLSAGLAFAVDDPTIPLVIGGGLFTTGIVITLVNGDYGAATQDQRRIAFESYGDDLRDHLKLCPGPNQALVDCPDNSSTLPVELTRSQGSPRRVF